MKKIVAFFLATCTFFFAGCISTQNHAKWEQKQVQLAATQTRYLLLKPQDYDPARRYPLFIFMHCRGDSPEAVIKYVGSVFSQREFFILLPQAPDPVGNGFSWYDIHDPIQFKVDVDRDERLIKSMIEKVEDEHRVDSSQIVLSGFSQGGRLSFYIGFRNPRLFTKIIPVSGAYMPEELDSQLAGLNGLKVCIYHGTEDTLNSFSRMQIAYQHLKQKGVNVTLDAYPLGHDYTPEIMSKILGEATK